MLQPGGSVIELAQQQKFHQGFLHMQAVFCFVPHDALRAVDYFSTDFLAAMGWQAMHEQRIGVGARHHCGIDAPVGEGLLARFVFGFVAHAGPDVGGDEVGTDARFAGIGEFTVKRRAL